MQQRTDDVRANLVPCTTQGMLGATRGAASSHGLTPEVQLPAYLAASVNNSPVSTPGALPMRNAGARRARKAMPFSDVPLCGGSGSNGGGAALFTGSGSGGGGGVFGGGGSSGSGGGSLMPPGCGGGASSGTGTFGSGNGGNGGNGNMLNGGVCIGGGSFGFGSTGSTRGGEPPGSGVPGTGAGGSGGVRFERMTGTQRPPTPLCSPQEMEKVWGSVGSVGLPRSGRQLCCATHRR